MHSAPKVTNKHISLTPFLIVNTPLAAQVLCESIFQALQIYGYTDAINIYRRIFGLH